MNYSLRTAIFLHFEMVLLSQIVYGLKCWTCENAVSIAACHMNGNLQICDDNQVHCVLEVRTVNGLGKRVSKQCKQKDACLNDQKQNIKTFWRPQCNGVGYQSVCRCCCATNNCNREKFQCGAIEMCERPQNIRNGNVVCPRTVIFGTKCALRCNRGYRINKPLLMQCQLTNKNRGLGEFSNLSTLKCMKVPKRCSILKPRPLSRKKCYNTMEFSKKRLNNFEGSVCKFTCRKNFFPSSPSQLVCRNGLWDYKAPKCIRGTCPIPPRHENMISTCTFGYRFGSTCRYSCSTGYSLNGNAESTCVQSEPDSTLGYWTNNISPCHKVLCPILTSPSNGELICTDGNNQGSVCIFTCMNGNYMEGQAFAVHESVCQVKSNGVGEWSKLLPKCLPIICSTISLKIENGFVLCSDGNRWGSGCKYSCDYGFDLPNTFSKVYRITCRSGEKVSAVGEWSGNAPKCLPVRCFAPRRSPVNGFVVCSNENFAGSTCIFRCKHGFDLDKTRKRTLSNICIDEGFGSPRGEWDTLPGTCRKRIFCRRRLISITNGKVTCSNENFAGSSCRFTCNSGYKMVGNQYTFCSDRDKGTFLAKWTNPMPKCIKKLCPKQWYDPIVVTQSCRVGFRKIDFTEFGTKCTYACKYDGYYAVGSTGNIIRDGKVSSTCLPSLVWNRPPPRCFIKTCQHLHTPQNGYKPKCSNGHDFGSTCQFACKAGFTLSHFSPLRCINGQRGLPKGKWHLQPPICSPK